MIPSLINDSLEVLAAKYILDKSISTKCHNYIPGYSLLFDPIRNNVKNLLEIGIGSVENGQMSGVVSSGYKTGNSLRCWRDFFPNANIYGIDLYHHDLHENRIMTFVADQSKTADLLNVINSINNPIDVIIDDGSHIYEHQAFTFLFLEKYLSDNGIYVIEDIQPGSIENFKKLNFLDEHQKEYIKNKYNIVYFDTRHVLNRADDFMVAFLKK